MKNLILPAVLLLAVTLNAQTQEGKASVAEQKQIKEGRIIYERTIQMPVRAFGNGDASVMAQLPKSRTDQYELLFGNNQSLWQFLPTAANEEPGTFSGNGVVLRFAGTNDINYYDLNKGLRIDQREVMNQEFLVSDTIRKISWKLTNDVKTVLDFTVRKAIGTRTGTRPQISVENGEMKRTMIPDTATITAWFTTEIPVSVSPELPGQLPGAVLELDVNNGQTVYKAIEISPKVNVAKIKAPSQGKKVTAAEFQQEREKVMNEMRRNMPAGNTIRLN